MATMVVAAPEERQSSTLGELVVNVLGKELMHIWLRSDPGSFDVHVHRNMMLRIGPSLASDVVDLIRRWVPGVGLECRTLLPDLRKFPPEIEDCHGLDLTQRKLMVESLEVLLTGMPCPFASDDREWRRFLNEAAAATQEARAAGFGAGGGQKSGNATQVPNFLSGGVLSFPTESLAAISAQINQAVERVLIFSQPARVAAASSLEALVEGGEAAVMAMKAEGERKGSVLAGATKEQLSLDKVLRPKQGLISELQKARRRMFEMERELAAKEHKKLEQVAWERSEREKDTSRLMQLNTILEERLRKRTDEGKELQRQIEEGKRRVEHANLVLLEKQRKIEKLEQALSTSSRMTEDVLEREREYGRRMLRLRVAEDQSMQSQKLRIEKLQRLIRTEQSGASPLEAEVPLSLTEGESHIAAQTKETLERVEKEFDSFFEQRQEKFREALETYERKLGEKKEKFELTCQELSKAEAMQACVLSGAFGRKQTRSIAAQVSFRRQPGELPQRDSPLQAASETPRGSMLETVFFDQRLEPKQPTTRRVPKTPGLARPQRPRSGPATPPPGRAGNERWLKGNRRCQTPQPVLVEAEPPPFTFDTRFLPPRSPKGVEDVQVTDQLSLTRSKTLGPSMSEFSDIEGLSPAHAPRLSLDNSLLEKPH